ncbi:MAG: hypothetical protein KC591_15335, partial [Gemmatimonadetes bacterium]|nr:hypothetical protein [Gemmatimonadota bacterium]
MLRSLLAGISLALGLSLACPPPAAAVRVMTYNLLNYSGGRTAEFQVVLAEAQPDVVVAEEVLSLAGVNAFLTGVLDVVNPGEWVAGPFTDGPDTDNAVFYRPAKLTFVSQTTIPTVLREIDEYVLRPVSHSTPAADLRLYAVHLKASQGSSNEQQRLAESQTLRSHLETYPVGQSYAIMGDFNIYQASEPAYQYMINPVNGAAGVVQDPIAREGNWHVNPAFADVHTQSPRVTQFGGGANGGMDDRFDFMLTGPSTFDGEGWDILPSTYTALGQDGQHFDGALNVPPYLVVTAAVAQALHDASDHLPVFADWQVPARLSTVASLDLGPVIVGGTTAVDLLIENVAPLPADELDYSFAAPTGFGAPAGTFQLLPGGPVSHSITLDGGSVGFRSGDLVVTSDDPDSPARNVSLSGVVLDHADPSTSSALSQLVASVDFGSVVGDTAIVVVEAHDLGWTPLRAELEIWNAALVGDPRFFVPTFVPGTAGLVPYSLEVAFDGVGAADGEHAGTLTLSTRDASGLPGGVDLSDLTYELVAIVGDGTDAPAVAASFHSGLGVAAPNPFRHDTSITYALARSGAVDLRVFDVRGRLVRELAQGIRAAGRHEEHWDGRDRDGHAMAPG